MIRDDPGLDPAIKREYECCVTTGRVMSITTVKEVLEVSK
jgi:hypothetical protein